MINRADKYRIYADLATQEFFSRCCGVVRLVYNIALEQRSSFFRQFKRAEGKNISYPSQARELTAIRAEVPWIAECPIDAQQQALRDLDQAFRNFFAGRAGYPRPRRKFVNDAFRIPSSRIGRIEVLNRKWARLRLPKIGNVKFRYTRPIRGEVGNVTVIREANGWHIVFSCAFDHQTPANDNPAVGIDRGIVNNIALSTGEMYAMPDGSVLEEKHKEWQRTASRRKKHSTRQAKARRHAAKIAAKAARKRLHWQHVTTARIARRFGTAVIEDLKIRNMSASAKGTVEEPGRNVAQKAGLNRSILAAAWFRFELLLTYKLAFFGGSVAKADPRHTSVTCPECGSRDKGNRENQAKFLCLSCEHTDHADVNAARNILAAGTRPATWRSIPSPRTRKGGLKPPLKIPVLHGGEDVKNIVRSQGRARFRKILLAVADATPSQDLDPDCQHLQQERRSPGKLGIDCRACRAPDGRFKPIRGA